MEYLYLANFANEFSVPEKGILSHVLHKDAYVNITAFGFTAGEDLSSHASPTPAILQFLEGEAEVGLGDDTVLVQAGSLIYMPPHLPHSISAKTPVKMLLVQMKAVD